MQVQVTDIIGRCGSLADPRQRNRFRIQPSCGRTPRAAGTTTDRLNHNGVEAGTLSLAK